MFYGREMPMAERGRKPGRRDQGRSILAAVPGSSSATRKRSTWGC